LHRKDTKKSGFPKNIYHPKAFNDWIKNNHERLQDAMNRGALPYWLKDNETYRDPQSNLRINLFADKNELFDNIRTGRILANNYPEKKITIRAHLEGEKNPEYDIDNVLADAKRIESWNVASSFNKAIKQECKIVIIDLFKMQGRNLNANELAKNIIRRFDDFKSEKIDECYIVWDEKSMIVGRSQFNYYHDSKRFNYVIELERKIRKGLL
jgi:hypothetical protein